MQILRWLMAVPLAAAILPRVQSEQRSFSVKDDISMTRISSPHPQPHVPSSEIAWPSPNGKQVAIVVTRGILSSDLIESQILVFDVNRIKRGLANPVEPMPRPRIVASIRSVSTVIETDAYAPVIKDVRWSADSSTVYFRATNLSGNYQLCMAKSDGSGFKKLTPANKSVDRFDINGETIVYNAADPEPRLIAAGKRINRDALDITGARLQDVLFPNELSARVNKLFRLYIFNLNARQSAPQKVPMYNLEEIPYITLFYPFRISPNSKQLIKLEPPTSVPDSWSAYAPTDGLEHLRLTNSNDSRLLRSDNVLRPLQYALINLETGQRTPLVDAPNARSLGYLYDENRVAWSADGTRVLVTNTFLPVSNEGKGSVTQTRPCSVASVELPSRTVHCLELATAVLDPDAPHIQDVSFTESPDEALILQKDGPGKQILQRYHFHANVWSLVSTQPLSHTVRTAADFAATHAQDANTLRIYVDQSLNDPPKLWGSDHNGDRRVIWDPNPQFSQLRFGYASPYQWKDVDGRDWSGILVKPVNYIEGQSYPLIVQMYNYVDGQFITDGLYPTAFAARELASAGFVVLQIRKHHNTISEEDPKIHLEGYRSAIQSLSSHGLIDPNKVGVVGFSWTCWYVAEAIVDDPKLFAAATIADGLDNSYMQYKLFTVADYILEQQMTKIRNGSPFGAGLQHWVEAAPGFRADRVEVPVRIETIGPSSVLQEWELYASLQLLRKPVDLIYFPNGSHIHELPLERLESQQGNVDWLRFWLQGYERPDPEDPDQYERWEHLRELKQTNLGKVASEDAKP